VATEDARWYDWSAKALADAAERQTLVINAVIFSELSVGFQRIETMQSILDPQVFEYRPIPPQAAFLAGKAFARYRRRRGSKVLPLPDFFIGAHAGIEQLPLITRDPKRFRTYFPKLQIISPS
jgi:hypothetical protein